MTYTVLPLLPLLLVLAVKLVGAPYAISNGIAELAELLAELSKGFFSTDALVVVLLVEQFVADFVPE
ncbi:hypothetical protein [uncultured Shewanella sp.]|uniref:hypothetical protein n=1 Tax=uncultured Shewanella sp. TaxID=173975 RepID=UPI0026044D7C|nr:hypothetical protein [uncultured Shewanella sp.]